MRRQHGDDVALRADGVARSYGRVAALCGLSLVVRRRECVALVGESGSGKTTLLRCFNAMVVPDAGRIEVNGAAVGSVDAFTLRRGIGYVQQEGGLLPHWSVRRNAALVPWLQRRADATALGDAALELVGLPPGEYGDRRPSELSGGQRQRVAIARALAARPSTVLLDEPFGALDAITRAELQEAFRSLRRRTGITALLVTHDMHEAFLLADRIAVLRGGRIEQCAPPGELVSSPATDYVARLLVQARLRPG